MNNNTDVQETEKVEQETTQKTYTEQDIQNSFNAGVKKANSEWQKDEKYKEFLAWKKTSQSESERVAELQTNYDNAVKENAYLKALMKVNESECKKEFNEFVTSEVLKRVDDKTDFDKALEGYKKEKPQYFGEIVVKKVQSSPSVGTGEPHQTTTNDIMNNILRGAKN